MVLLYLGLLAVVIPLIALGSLAGGVVTGVVIMCIPVVYIAALIAYVRGLHTPRINEVYLSRLVAARQEEHFAHDRAFLAHELGHVVEEDEQIVLEAHFHAVAEDLERTLNPEPVHLTDEQASEW